MQLWGAGGGGGGGACKNSSFPNNCFNAYCGPNNSGACGGPGGNGGYNKDVISVTPGNNYTITIGLGGTPGNGAACTFSCQGTSGTSGQSGGNSTFNGVLVAIAGTGGQGGNYSNGTNGSNGINGSVINYNTAEISYLTPSNLSPISYIPSGYIISTLIPDCCASGGGGGTGACGNGGDFCPNPGGVGQNGYCVISY